MIEISFVIPMYNAEKYIENCIASILDQGIDGDRMQIIVVDDGSTDGGRDIVKRYGDVEYYYQENKGQSAARNKGIELAKGRYICFVDADDELVHNSIKYCLEYALSNDLQMMAYDMIGCSEEGKCKIQITNSDNISSAVTGVEYLANNNYNNGPCWYLVKKDCLNDLNFVEGHFGEDGMFTMELLMKLERVAKIDRQCYCYIRRSGSTTTSRDRSHLDKMVADYLFVYLYMQKLIDNNRNRLTKEAYERCDDRSKTYIFYLMVRVMRFASSAEYIDDVMDNLSENGISEISRPPRKDYHGIKYDVIAFILNRRFLVKCVNLALNVKRS